MRPPVRSLRALAGLTALLAAACGDPDATESSESDLKTSTGLRDKDFDAPLDRDFIRAASTNLDRVAFDRKWTASRESPVMFMRAYPGAYHRDLASVPAARIPGKEGLCFGDAHPDNFGFMEIGGRTLFVYNDLDDSGPCPVILDAARYFAVLRLYFDDGDLDRDVLEQYVDTLKDRSRAKTLDPDLRPDWAKERAKDLEASTLGGRFRLSDALHAPSAGDRADIARLVASDPRLRGTTLRDVATLERDSGGSGGLTRHWLLVRRGAEETILELKETATAGTELGRHTRSLPRDERLDALTRAFWSTTSRDDHFYVKLGGATFLVRDRLAKHGIDLAELGRKERRDVLDAQVSLMAALHAPALEDVKKDDIRSWVKDTSRTLAKRWSRAM